MQIIILLVSCNYRDGEIGKIENYKLVEKAISKDCTISQLIYNDGSYICRYSLSGSCIDLSIENYINEYSYYLTQHKKEIENRSGYIIFDHYFKEKKATNFIDSIINVTKLHFSQTVKLLDSNENSVKIEIMCNTNGRSPC
ncbi:MAG: hypothetical protein ACK567_02735 [Chitinophagales bacterium]|jgi:hypothetical protein